MKRQFGILVDLDRCVGCYACEVACRQENASLLQAPWIRVHAIGPEFVSGKLKMDFVPRISEQCDFCQSRDWQPSCIAHCPTKALVLSPTVLIMDALNSNPRYQICKIL